MTRDQLYTRTCFAELAKINVSKIVTQFAYLDSNMHLRSRAVCTCAMESFHVCTMATASVGVSDLLASAFSSTLGSTVVTYDQYKEKSEKKDEYEIDLCHCHSLNIDQLFNYMKRLERNQK